MAAKKVFVYENEDALIVFPPVIVLTTGDTLTLVNATEENLDWEIPAGVFGNNPHSEKVIQKNNSAAKPVPGGATATASTYQVRGRSTKKKGKGNSDPVIIIVL